MSLTSSLTLNQQSIAQRVGIYLPPKFLANAQPWLMLERFAEKESLPKNKGETITWRRSVPHDVDTASLVEGVTPAPQNFRMENVTNSIKQYGRYVNLTDKVHDLHEDKVLDEVAKELAKQAAVTKEMISWETIRNGTQVLYSGVATTRATVVDILTLAPVRAAVALLKGNHGDMLTGKIAASTNYGTEAVAPAYVAVGHTNMDGDVRDLDGFTPTEKYGNGKGLNDYEIGKVENIRFCTSPHLEPFYGAGSATITGIRSRDAANADVYATIVMAKGFWGTTTLSSVNDIQTHAEAPGKPSKEDPLGQRGFAMWKYYFCATRLNEDWGVRIESAATDWS